ncbi:MAG: ethylbenzene dehydrogenase-related protein [Nitrospinaceae bacterium]
MRKIRTCSTALGLGLFIFSIPMGPAPAYAAESRSIERLIEAAEPFEGQELLSRQRRERVEEGKEVFRRYCVHCHGSRGKGDGRASPYLFPLPRDLTLGIFKFRSTKTNTLPLDRDLARTIQRGVPGTAMPAWKDILPEESLGPLIAYIKTFSGRFQMETPNIAIDAGLEPPMNSLAIDAGKSIYRELRCWRCHGREGEREGPLGQNLKDSWGNPSAVYDLAQPSLYKGGASSRDIYRTLASGMDGTPMNAYDYLSEDEIWHLVHYLQSRFVRPGPAGDPSSGSNLLTSYRVEGKIEPSPDNPLWRKIPFTRIPLLPLKSGPAPLTSLRAQSIHNGQTLAFRLQWADPTPDGASAGARFFLDAVALQFAPQKSPVKGAPFFGMGERNRPVQIWHWRADATQTITGPARTSLSPSEEDKNLAARSLDRFRESPVEEIDARGFGTLLVQPLEDQQVTGQGTWKDGNWIVVLVRDLKSPGPRDIQFQPREPVLVAAALWDGARKDKNAKKKVSLWQVLKLQ